MHTTMLLALMAPAQGGAGMIVFVVQIAALIAIFYFLLIRPQSQARAKHAAMLESLKKGDKVVTSGGVIGKVTAMKANEITIESGTAQLVVERARIVQIGDTVAPAAASS